MAVLETGSSSAGNADVNSDFELKVSLNKAAAKAGFAGLVGLTGDEALGTKVFRPIRSSLENRMAVGQDCRLDWDVFNQAAQPTGKYNYGSTTLTAAWAGGWLTLNASAITTASSNALVQSRRLMPLPCEGGLAFETFAQFTSLNATNLEHYFGRFFSSNANGINAPNDGAYFKITSAGLFGSYVNNGGTEANVALTGITLVNGQTYKFRMVEYNRRVEYYVDDVLYGTLSASANANISYSTINPIGFQTRILGAIANNASQAKFGAWVVYTIDSALYDNRDQIANGKQGQQGWTQGQLSRYTNNTNQTAAVATNTTAALGTGLGGEFVETDTLAVNTDGIIQSFQNPSHTIAANGKNILIRGVWIESFVSTAIVAGGYNALFVLNTGNTAVLLGGSEVSNAKSPRRDIIGSYAVAAGAAALTQLPRIYCAFNEPIVVYPGEFIAISKKKVGTVPTSGVITYGIGFDYKIQE
jgi:hypothetical protein